MGRRHWPEARLSGSNAGGSVMATEPQRYTMILG